MRQNAASLWPLTIGHSLISIRYTLFAICYLLLATTAFSQQLIFQDFIEKHKVSTIITTPTSDEAKESGVILRQVQVVEFGFDSLGMFECYEGTFKRLHLNDAKGVEMYNKIFLPVPNTSDLLYLKARSISKNGVVREVGIEAVKEIEEQGRLYKILAIEGIEVGGELEYLTLHRRNNNTFGRELLQNDIPVRRSQLQIISPSNLIFEAKVYNYDKPKILADSSEGRYFVNVEVENLPAIYTEKYSNVRANLVRADFKLSYNTEKGKERLYTWEEATDTFFGFLTNGLADSKKDVNSFLVNQKIKGLTPELAIRGIENYVKEKISYRESEDQETAADVLKNQFGDKAGIVRLYIAAFEALKIPYQVVVGSARNVAMFDKDFESWNFLEEYLFYFPTLKKYLDPLTPTHRLGLIEQYNEGQNALFIIMPKSESEIPKYEIRQIPFLPVEKNIDDLVANVAFSPNLDQIEGNFTRIMTGHVAAQLRPYFYLIKNEEQRKAIIGDIVKSVVKADADYSNVQIKNTNLTNNEVNLPFTFGVDAKLKSVLEKAGKKVLFKVGELIGPQVEMYDERPRQHDIDMGNAHSYHRVLKIKIPEGYKISGGLESIKRSITDGTAKPQLGFVANYKLEKNVLTITVDEFYKVVQLPKNSYEVFKSVINAAADFNKVTLVLEKK